MANTSISVVKRDVEISRDENYYTRCFYKKLGSAPGTKSFLI